MSTPRGTEHTQAQYLAISCSIQVQILTNDMKQNEAASLVVCGGWLVVFEP